MHYQDNKIRTILSATGHSEDPEDNRWMDWPGGEIDTSVEHNRNVVYGALAEELGCRPEDIDADTVRAHADMLAGRFLDLRIY